VLEHAFPAFECQIEPGKIRVPLLEFIHHAQRLQVVFEPAVFAHAVIECVLASVPEWGVAEIVRQADGFGQRFIDAERACDGAADLRHLERMRDSRAVQVAFVIHEHLSLVDQPAKCI
jgi:hypothetical protein